MTTPTREDVLAELQGLRAGIEKNLATLSFMVAGETWSGADALAFVDKAIARVLAIGQAHAALRGAIAANEQFRSANGATLKAIRDMIRLMYLDRPTSLAEFSMEPRKVRAPLSNDALVARAEKAKATRIARRTMGKRQRLAIKGNVAGVEITPIIAKRSSDTDESTD